MPVRKPKIPPRINGTKPYIPYEDPERDAWYTAFFIENHMDYFAYPEHVGTPEQVRFMVYTENEERYFPCSDAMFEAILNRDHSDFLQKKYAAVHNRVVQLIERLIEDPREKAYLSALIQIKFGHETEDEMMIPSRLEKRLVNIFLNRTQIADPYLCEKGMRNLRAANALGSKACKQALNRLAVGDIDTPDRTLIGTRERIRLIELKRLLALTAAAALWTNEDSAHFTEEDFLRFLSRPVTGAGADALFSFLGITGRIDAETPALVPRKILWLADEAGEIMVDLVIIRLLARLGHKIVIAFKDGPVYTKVDFDDAHSDEALGAELESAHFLRDKNLGKNALADILRSEHNILAVSDGTRENVNLLLACTTFARLFKEVDGVVSRGPDQRRRFFETHFQFTQDIFNISSNGNGEVKVLHKPRHPAVIKYSYRELEHKAQGIVDEMRRGKENGMTVMFYSGIIGSIPGKLETAKRIMSVFIAHLKKEYARTFIINPSEYFEHGMDADDLMYMWEIVQRSGAIDIWRFQTYEDIARAFALMESKVPPEWVGKDATFSTGCTKEMTIALEVQKEFPEMQIVGPSPEKFVRRSDYGVGMLYDQKLRDICR